MLKLMFDYCVILIKEMMRLVMMSATAILLSMGLMYSYIGAWQVYTHTQIGVRFLESKFVMAEQIQIFLEQGTSWTFLAEVGLISLVASVTIAIVFQLLFIRHLLYTNIPLAFKAVLCFGLAVGLARYQMETYHLTNHYIAALLFIPFTLLLFPACMKSVPKFIPNLGQVALFLFESMNDFLNKYK